MVGSASFKDDLVYVSALNEFVYCPRRYYYQRFYDAIETSYELADGRSKHEGASKRGGWVTERYFRSDELGLHGKIDVMETDSGRLTPVERKRAESGSYYQSDELQLAGYCMLLEDAIGESIGTGYIYLYSTDTRHPVEITPKHREAVRQVVKQIRTMSVGDIPPITDNKSKCDACSAREHCMPGETAVLAPERAAGTAWEGELPGEPS